MCGSGSGNEGVARIQNGKLTRLIPENSVTAISLTEEGPALISHSRGLHAFEAGSGNLLFKLDHGDGLLTSHTTGAVLHDETLYIAHPTGVTSMRYDEAQIARHVDPQVLIRPLGDYRRNDQLDLIVDRDPRFLFYAASYRDPAAMNYEYRIGGEEWVRSDGRQVSFHRLAGGAHTLEVRARFRTGMPGPASSITFIVPTPFYQTTWFRGLILLVFGAVLASAVRARHFVIQRREEELRRLIDERTHELANSMEMVKQQAELLRKQDELQRRFFTNISHEFKTPLTVIKGITEDLASGRNGEIHSNARAPLHIALENANRLTRLVGELLDLARLEDGKLELQPRAGYLGEFVRKTTIAYTPAAERKGVSLVYREIVSNYHTTFDPDAIEKVIANLVSNAIKYTDAGGRIQVRVIPDSDERGVTIQVCDDGSGIEAELLPHIFDRFTSSEDREGSTGIGLALVKELVELQGGTVAVDSEPGRGSCFCVRLPFERHQFEGDGRDISIEYITVDAVEPEVGANGSLPTQANSGSGLVLVVDDNRDIRRYIASHLSDHYDIREASDGVEALELARESRPDLIVSDVMMPRMNGEDLCRSIREDEGLEDIPILLVTARSGPDAAVSGYNGGADGYIEKPFDINVLKARVHRMITNRRLLRERFSERLVIEELGLEIESEEEEMLRKVISVLEENLDNTAFNVENLAYEVGLSSRRLRRRIGEATGETPSTFIRRYRLERAARMLEAKAGSVSEISYRVGYPTPTVFASHFKKMYGSNPSDYVGARATDADG